MGHRSTGGGIAPVHGPIIGIIKVRRVQSTIEVSDVSEVLRSLYHTVTTFHAVWPVPSLGRTYLLGTGRDR